MNDQQFFTEYLIQRRDALASMDVSSQLVEVKDLICKVHAEGKKMIVAGNGGSAAIASHCAVDFSKAARIRCMTFNEPSLITCLANDFGYDRWLEKAIEMYAEEGDLLVLISSSGRSRNMIRAADFAIQQGLRVVTFTGFASTNPLRARGDVNVWVKSRSYNFIELFHQLWLLAVCDFLVAQQVSESLKETARLSVAV